MRWYALALLFVSTVLEAQWDLQTHSVHGATVVQDTPYQTMVQLDTGVGASLERVIGGRLAVGFVTELRRTLPSRVSGGFRYHGTDSFSMGTRASAAVGPVVLRLTGGATWIAYSQTNALLFSPYVLVAAGARLRPLSGGVEEPQCDSASPHPYVAATPFFRWDFRADTRIAATIGIMLSVGLESLLPLKYLRH